MDLTFISKRKAKKISKKKNYDKEIIPEFQKELETKNEHNYELVKVPKSSKKIVVFLILIILFLIGFLVYHFVTFDHSEPRVETKIEEVVSENIVFLGDSITAFYDLEKYFPDEPVVNSGVGENTTDDILEDMKNRVYQYNPSKVFLLIGTNDLQNGKTPEEIFDNIKRIVEGIQENRPKAKIYLESISPVNHNFERNGAQNRQNEDIKEINEKIKKYCTDEHLTYIDLYSALEDENGDLRAEYTTEGLHLSEEGYAVVTETIEKYLPE